MNIYNGVRNTETIKQADIRGLKFNVNLVAATVNQDLSGKANPATTVCDLSKILVSVILRRSGREKQVVNSNLLILGMESHFQDAGFEFLMPASTQKDITKTAHGAAAYNAVQIPVKVDFGAVLNIRDNDELIVDVYVQNGTFGTDVSQSTSYLEVKPIAGIGLEYVTPEVRVVPIKASENNVQYFAGDNVLSITFVNVNKTSTAEADLVLSSAKLSSDRISFVKTFYDLMHERAELTEGGITNSDYRGQSVQIHAGEIDQAQIDLTFTSANVEASKNFLVIRSFEGDRQVYSRAAAREAKHRRYDMQKVSR